MRKGKCDNINEGKTFLPALGTDVIASVLPVCWAHSSTPGRGGKSGTACNLFSHSSRDAAPHMATHGGSQQLNQTAGETAVQLAQQNPSKDAIFTPVC